MMSVRNAQSGFTAVELLITLFVAAAFLIASYQLFNVVIKDGGQARAESRAGNIAYDYMRRYSTQATNPCASSNPLTNAPVSVDGLSDVTVSVAIACVQDTTPSMSKIQVAVRYNSNPQQLVRYSTYVNSTTPQVPDITDGLTGWWKLNGNANSSVGTSNGTFIGSPTPTTGQNSQDSSTAYSFASGQGISVPSLPSNSTTQTFMAWVRPASYPSERSTLFITWLNSGVSASYMSLNTDGSLQMYWYGTTPAGYHTTPASTVPLNQWTHVAVSWSGTAAKLYINGTLRNTVAVTGAGNGASYMYIAYDPTQPTRPYIGMMDDARVYNRALTDQEILTIANGGAK